VLIAIKTRYAFTSLEPIQSGGYWWVEGQVNPISRAKTQTPVSPQGQLVINRLINGSIDDEGLRNKLLAPEYRAVNYGGLLHIQKTGKGVSVPELRVDKAGIIGVGKQGVRRDDYSLIEKYNSEIGKITQYLNDEKPPRKLEGNPATLVTRLEETAKAGRDAEANGIRGQMRRIIEYLQGPDWKNFTGVEVSLGQFPMTGSRSADYTISSKEGNVIVEVKNWGKIRKTKDKDVEEMLSDKVVKLSNQLAAYLELAKAKSNNYDIIRLEWIGFAKLDEPHKKIFKDIISTFEKLAEPRKIKLEFRPM
jgi:hypothetical protein